MTKYKKAPTVSRAYDKLMHRFDNKVQPENNAELINQLISIIITNLDDLGDVAIQSLVNGQHLVYSQSDANWKNTTSSGGVSSLDDLSDVAIQSVANNHYLVYNQSDTNFKNQALSIALADLSNVTISSPADNEVLAYNSGDTTWKNQTAAEAGLATSGHNHSGVYEPVNSKIPVFGEGTYTGDGGTSKAIAHSMGSTCLWVFIWREYGADNSTGNIWFKGQYDGNYAQGIEAGGNYNRDNRINTMNSTYFYVDDDSANYSPNTSGATYNWIAFGYT